MLGAEKWTCKRYQYFHDGNSAVYTVNNIHSKARILLNVFRSEHFALFTVASQHSRRYTMTGDSRLRLKDSNREIQLNRSSWSIQANEECRKTFKVEVTKRKWHGYTEYMLASYISISVIKYDIRPDQNQNV